MVHYTFAGVSFFKGRGFVEKKKAKTKKMNLFTLIMVSSAFVVSVRNFPTEAETSLHMIFFALVAAIGFFIPAALVSAELATGWPKGGGVYVWIKEAFGDRLGFFGVCLQWSYMIIGVIAMLYFVGGSLAFVFDPALANNRIFLLVVLLVVLWGATFISMRGQSLSGLISTIGFLGGVLFPGLLIIILGIIYFSGGNPSNIDLTFSAKNIFPSFKSVSTIVLLVGFMRTFSGIEASSSHANEVEKPKRNYPIAILIVVLLGLLLNIFGSISVAIVVPQKEISLLSGLMEAFSIFFSKFHMQWFVPYMGIFVAIGAIGGISTWIMGPIKGMFAAAKNGELPRFCQKSNKHGAPRNLLIIQACLVSLVGGTLLLMPKLNIAFWISVAIAMMIYFTMYLLMYLAAIRLRYKEPKVKRAYKIPFGNVGIWVVGILGLITVVFSYIVAFFPPAQLPPTHIVLYEIVLISGVVTILSIPFIVYSLKKPSWKVTRKRRSVND
jgi:glutamate:GABA antiporter